MTRIANRLDANLDSIGRERERTVMRWKRLRKWNGHRQTKKRASERERERENENNAEYKYQRNTFFFLFFPVSSFSFVLCRLSIDDDDHRIKNSWNSSSNKPDKYSSQWKLLTLEYTKDLGEIERKKNTFFQGLINASERHLVLIPFFPHKCTWLLTQRTILICIWHNCLEGRKKVVDDEN